MWRVMSKRKLIVLFFLLFTVFLFFQWTQMKRIMEVFHLCCPARCSHLDPGLTPKHTNVAFLKTHKTGSSTVQNLLFRFAERHNLVVALSTEECNYQLCYPQFFTASFVHPHTVPPNIIATHMRFNEEELQRLMPEDTKYVTIMREPGSMFESLFTYFYDMCPSFTRVPNGSLEAFVEDPLRYYRPEDRNSQYAHNTMTHDLGGDNNRPASDEAYAQAFVEEMERVFSLVMITEYFDESLILLRHLLSWDLEDIVYVKLNMRTPSSKKTLTPDLTVKIRAWNSIDAHLYDHFNASLWRQLSALGLDCVAREVDLLRQEQERLVGDCFGGQPHFLVGSEIENEDIRPWNPNENVDIVGYELPGNLSAATQEFCLKLVMPEVQYSDDLLQSQSLRYQELHVTP